MMTTTSADGTTIAYEQFGAGEPLIVVGGAMCDRARSRPTSEELAKSLSVINYDRRGRGDSGDHAPYAVEHEIEDLAGLIEVAGGAASVYGHSSGAALALRAAAAGLQITTLVLHEPPFSPGGEVVSEEARSYGQAVRELLARDRRGDAVELFFTRTGMPAEMISGMRQSPAWPALEALAPTLAYDSEVMGDLATGGVVPIGLLGRVNAPTLVICGGQSPSFFTEAAALIVDGIPQSRHVTLENQHHVVPPEILAPTVQEFVASSAVA